MASVDSNDIPCGGRWSACRIVIAVGSGGQAGREGPGREDRDRTTGPKPQGCRPQPQAEPWRESHPDSLVTVEFRPDGAGTSLVLARSALPDENAVDRHRVGREGCLEKLVRIAGA